LATGLLLIAIIVLSVVSSNSISYKKIKHISTNDFFRIEKFKGKENSFKASNRILILTIAVGSEWYVPYVKENRLSYCKKHDYDLKFVENLPENFDVHPSWAKIHESMLILSENKYEWIYLTDLDSVIMNDSIKLEKIVKLA
jgi:hypothetical protein